LVLLKLSNKLISILDLERGISQNILLKSKTCSLWLEVSILAFRGIGAPIHPALTGSRLRQKCTTLLGRSLSRVPTYLAILGCLSHDWLDRE
jgi:hypothetical protein